MLAFILAHSEKKNDNCSLMRRKNYLYEEKCCSLFSIIEMENMETNLQSTSTSANVTSHMIFYNINNFTMAFSRQINNSKTLKHVTLEWPSKILGARNSVLRWIWMRQLLAARRDESHIKELHLVLCNLLVVGFLCLIKPYALCRVLLKIWNFAYIAALF